MVLVSCGGEPTESSPLSYDRGMGAVELAEEHDSQTDDGAVPFCRPGHLC